MTTFTDAQKARLGRAADLTYGPRGSRYRPPVNDDALLSALEWEYSTTPPSAATIDARLDLVEQPLRGYEL